MNENLVVLALFVKPGGKPKAVVASIDSVKEVASAQDAELLAFQIYFLEKLTVSSGAGWPEAAAAA